MDDYDGLPPAYLFARIPLSSAEPRRSRKLCGQPAHELPLEALNWERRARDRRRAAYCYYAQRTPSFPDFLTQLGTGGAFSTVPGG